MTAPHTWLADISHHVNDLTRPLHHRHLFTDAEARLQGRRLHTAAFPSLLDQLRATTRPTKPGGEEDPMRGIFESRPSARLDALAALIHIDHWSTLWLTRDLGRKPRHTTEDTLRGIVGAAATTHDPDTLRLLHRDVASWARMARITTGWERPPYTPRGSCPACEHRGTIRVRLDERIALCVDCGEQWTPDTIGILAEHIRWQHGEADTPHATPA